MEKENAQKAVDAVKKFIELKTADLNERMEGLENSLKELSELKSVIDGLKKSVEDFPIPKDGKDVDKKEVGELVERLVNQAFSKLTVPKNGEDGRDGRDGEDGMDAVELEILPEIDVTAAYSRSTYAKHNGGLWKAVASTSGMKGWECIIEGVGDIDIDYDGERELSIKVSKSSGDVVEKKFEIPVMIYKGVFREGNYKKGDTVTFGGSCWIAIKETSEKPGTNASDWKLATKRGSDGRDKTVKEGK